VGTQDKSADRPGEGTRAALRLEGEVRVLPRWDPTHDARAEAQLAALRCLIAENRNLVRDASP
jgi:hypothetical protein